MGSNKYGQLGGVDQGAHSERFSPWTMRGGVAWQALGDDATADDFLKAGGLDWEVEAKNLGEVMPDFVNADEHVIIRGNGRVLGHGVAGSYEVIQNGEVAEMAQYLVDLGKLTGRASSIKTAFSMHMGKQVVFSLEGDTVPLGGGSAQRFITVVTSHNGTLPFAILPSVVVTQCQNTLAMNLGRGKYVHKIKHTLSAPERILDAKQGLLTAYAGWDSFDVEAARLLDTEMTSAEFVGVLRKVMGDAPDKEGRAATIYQNRWEAIMTEYHADHNDYAEGTAWGAVMAINGYELWGATVRGGERAERQAEKVLRQGLGNPDSSLTHKVLALVGRPTD